MSAAVERPRWRVHVPTAGMTVVRLASRRSEDGEGWPVPRLLTELARLGVEREGPPRAVGSGTGVPVIHAVDLRWQGFEIYAEARHHAESGTTELVLELPSWDELASSPADEDQLWELVDVAAVCAEAEHGSLGDGEALELEPPQSDAEVRERCLHHAGVLTAERLAGSLGAAAVLYCGLPQSGLAVVLH